jgi:uncharacterized protein YutE (UPF0331/DUF86 family)
MIDRILYGKSRLIDRCIERVRQEYVGHEAEFATDRTRQDAAVLNLIRACEQAIDMANRMTLLRGLPIADNTGDTFVQLGEAGLIPADLAQSIKRMIGFGNIAMHEYQELDLAKVR